MMDAGRTKTAIHFAHCARSVAATRRRNSENPNGRPQYRVKSNLLTEWGGLEVNDGWLQRSACLPKFKDTKSFLKWFYKHKPTLIAMNN